MPFFKKNHDWSIFNEPSDLINYAISDGLISLDKKQNTINLNVKKPQEWKDFLKYIIDNSDNDFEINFTRQLLEKFDDFLNRINDFFDLDDAVKISTKDIMELKKMLKHIKTVDEFIEKI